MSMEENQSKPLTPKEIVRELDKYIIGQDKAKRSVAIALRNRWRRKQVSEELRDEIVPKNIIMIGTTGVGKTEIARRLAKLAQAPFVKVEATKYTEVGYVGRDVESMIRDLTEVSIRLVQAEARETVRVKAREMAEERVLDVLVPKAPPTPPAPAMQMPEYFEETEPSYDQNPPAQQTEANRATRDKFRRKLQDGLLDERKIRVEMQESSMPMIQMFSSQSGMEEIGMNMRDMFSNLFPKKTRQKEMTVAEALDYFTEVEAAKLIDEDKVQTEALARVENQGIVFLDEIDKIAGGDTSHGPDVSREGVQRDILPIVEGSTVVTKYGPVKTDHILFIAAGAFHVSKPSDLIPELQGRFPIRVELNNLHKEDLVRILTEPKNSLIRQYVEMMRTENVELEFTPEAAERIAEVAADVNEGTENIGARRLHTILEKLLDEVSFEAPDMYGATVTITPKYIDERLKDVLENRDLSQYIL